MTLGLILAAAAEGTDWISGSTLIAIISAITGAGGIMYGQQRGRAKERAESEHRTVSGSVKATVPQPLMQEQSAQQANWKSNDKDHENLFGRVGKLEQDIARVEAKTDSTFQFIEKQLDSLTNMVSQLFERIVKGKKS